jgi:hypothetical protein
LDGKLKERGVMMPTSQIVIDTILKELERLKILVQEESVIRAKF